MDHYEEQLTSHVVSSELSRFTVIRRSQDFQPSSQVYDILIVDSLVQLSLPSLGLLIIDGPGKWPPWVPQPDFLIVNTTELEGVAALLGSQSFCAASFPNAQVWQDMVLHTKMVTSSTGSRPIVKNLVFINRSAFMHSFYETVLDGVSFCQPVLTPRAARAVLTSLQKISDEADLLESQSLVLPAGRINRFIHLLARLKQGRSLGANFQYLTDSTCPPLNLPSPAPSQNFHDSKLAALESILVQLSGCQVGVFANCPPQSPLWAMLVQHGPVVSIVNQRSSVVAHQLQAFRRGAFRILVFHDTREPSLPEITHLIIWSFDTLDQIQRIVNRIDRLTSMAVEKTVYLLLEKDGIHAAILKQATYLKKRKRETAPLALTLLSVAILGDIPNTFSWVLKQLLASFKRFVWIEQQVLAANPFGGPPPATLDSEHLESEIHKWKPGIVVLTVLHYQLHLTSDLLVYAPDWPFSKLVPLQADQVIQHPEMLIFMSTNPVFFRQLLKNVF